MNTSSTQSISVRPRWSRGWALAGLLACLVMAGCSSVRILNPPDGATLSAAQPVEFEGEITRSSETGGADRSDELAWESSINGQLGVGRRLLVNTLTVGSHRITAKWPGHNRNDSITIRVTP